MNHSVAKSGREGLVASQAVIVYPSVWLAWEAGKGLVGCWERWGGMASGNGKRRGVEWKGREVKRREGTMEENNVRRRKKMIINSDRYDLKGKKMNEKEKRKREGWRW